MSSSTGVAVDLSGYEPVPIPRPWWERIPTRAAWLVVAFAALLLAAMIVPVPYAIRAPGPTVDTLGESDDTPLISIDGAETYPSEGQLRLTTVSVSGGPGFPVTAMQVVRAWLDPRQTVVPKETIFPPDQTREEADEASQAQMTSSQENATVAALTELGYEVPATLTLAGVVADGPADGVLEADDVLTAIEVGDQRTDLVDFDDLSDVLAQTPPGSDIEVTVDRDGEEVTESLTTGASDDGGSILGVLVDPTFDLPFGVDIEISNIGGSSAGTMFALGIMDTLTPGDATGGQVIAGTGTMSLDGGVGAIGGIVQKMNGAVRDGATYFLAPESNCDEVVGNVPRGLQVVKISTLEDAWTSVEAIGAGDATDLPTCG